jgi:hypothetical protein
MYVCIPNEILGLSVMTVETLSLNVLHGRNKCLTNRYVSEIFRLKTNFKNLLYKLVQYHVFVRNLRLKPFH